MESQPLIKVYSPDSPLKHPGQFLAELFLDLRHANELGYALAMRDFKAQFRQSYAGYLWAFLPVIVASATFLLLRSGGVLQFELPGVSYVAYVFVGTLYWQIFVDALNSPLRSALACRPMLIKINFPRSAILVSAFYSTVIQLGIRLAVLIPALFFLNPNIGPHMLLAPVGMLALIVVGLSIGLLLATVGMLYRDIEKSIVIVTSFWMLVTPVAFPPRAEGALGLVMAINPVSPIVYMSRAWTLGIPLDLPGTPDYYLAGFWLIFLAAACLLFLAMILNRLFLPRIIERLGM